MIANIAISTGFQLVEALQTDSRLWKYFYFDQRKFSATWWNLSLLKRQHSWQRVSVFHAIHQPASASNQLRLKGGLWRTKGAADSSRAVAAARRIAFPLLASVWAVAAINLRPRRRPSRTACLPSSLHPFLASLLPPGFSIPPHPRLETSVNTWRLPEHEMPI